jgi:DNA-binding MarR family transcriptional regulator
MWKRNMEQTYSELASLFFSMKQLLRSQLPTNRAMDPNAWLRFETLRFIDRAGPVSMRQLADHFRVKAPSATSLVHSLVKERLVERLEAEEDRRVVRIRLSKKGNTALETYERASVQALQKVFSRLKEEEIEKLISILRRLESVHPRG